MSAKRRFLHDDEARALQVAHDTLGDNCGRVDAPATFEPQRKSDHVPAGVSLSDMPAEDTRERNKNLEAYP